MKLRTRDSESLPSRPASTFFPSPPRPAPPFFQAKLRVGEAGDRFEREADQVAEQVVAGAGAPPVQKMCAECAAEKEGEPLRRQPAEPGAANGVASGVEGRLAATRSGGEALPQVVESSMSAAFGRDFSTVRVHTDAPAVQLSRDLDAAAFTQGNHVYFGEGQFAPGSSAGKRLLAHELTHVVQQGFAGASAAPVQRRSLADQPVQRTLMTGSDCSRITALPLDEKSQAVARGTHYTETFRRPSSGKVKVTVSARADGECHPGNNFGVDVVQCHIISDEIISGQHTADFGGKVSEEITLPAEAWNTYEKFYLRIRVNCAATVDAKVEAIP